MRDRRIRPKGVEGGTENWPEGILDEKFGECRVAAA